MYKKSIIVLLFHTLDIGLNLKSLQNNVLLIFCFYVGSQSISYAKTLTLLTFISKVQSESNEARSIEDTVTLIGLNLEDVKYDYKFQWRPSVRLGLTNDSSSQGVGFEVTKRNEFGTVFSLSTQYEEFHSDLTGNYSTSPSISFGVEQGLFRNWGSEIGRLPITRSEILKQKDYWSIVARKQSLIRNSIQKYFDAILSGKRYNLKSLGVDRASKNLEVTESRFSLGLVSKVDVYRTKLALLNSKDAEKGELRTLKRNKRIISNLINLNNIDDYSIEENITTFKFIMPSHFLLLALQARSDWQKYLLDEKLNRLELMQAKKKLMPDIRLSITAKKYFDEFETITGDLNDDLNWNVGLTYNTAFDLSREENALARQIIKNREHQRNRDQLKRKIIQEIDDAIDNLNLAQDRTMIATERLLQSEKAVDLSRLRFERGLSNNLDLVEAENAYQAANIDVLNQTIQVNLSKVLLAEKLGILDIKWLENALSIK
jgi:hypothetical protein